MDYYDTPCVQQGWQCPICKRVYSPTTSMCFYCGGKETITTTDITGTGVVTINNYYQTTSSTSDQDLTESHINDNLGEDNE